MYILWPQNEYIANQWCHRKRGVKERALWNSYMVWKSVKWKSRVDIFSAIDDDVWEEGRVSSTEQVFTEHPCWNIIHTVATCWNISPLPHPVNKDDVWKLLPKMQEDRAGDDEWHFEGSMWPVALDWMCLDLFLIVSSVALTDWEWETLILSPSLSTAMWSWVNNVSGVTFLNNKEESCSYTLDVSGLTWSDETIKRSSRTKMGIISKTNSCPQAKKYNFMEETAVYTDELQVCIFMALSPHVTACIDSVL